MGFFKDLFTDEEFIAALRGFLRRHWGKILLVVLLSIASFFYYFVEFVSSLTGTGLFIFWLIIFHLVGSLVYAIVSGRNYVYVVIGDMFWLYLILALLLLLIGSFYLGLMYALNGEQLLQILFGEFEGFFVNTVAGNWVLRGGSLIFLYNILASLYAYIRFVIPERKGSMTRYEPLRAVLGLLLNELIPASIFYFSLWWWDGFFTSWWGNLITSIIIFITSFIHLAIVYQSYENEGAKIFWKSFSIGAYLIIFGIGALACFARSIIMIGDYFFG